MKNKAIGIIGGMGSEASKEFYGLLIYFAQKYYQAEKNEDFPEILALAVLKKYYSDKIEGCLR